ncbi:MAG: rRNA pseudouridine synthase [Defluviitaleaceae bacterium]|nr:rRNA pseudouridine synthase [Defluviitaleaceae bacterium]
MEIRLQKLLANAGVASRRKAEALITAGRVTVNGIIRTELGTKASPNDEIAVDGKGIGGKPKQNLYVMLHKPEGVVTTVTDPFDRPTVMEFLTEILEEKHTRLFPVGRLDYDTSGLLLLTNDGDWTNILTHPRHKVSKTYIAIVQGTPSPQALDTFRNGVEIDGKPTAHCAIEIISQGSQSKVRITIKEGRNRQVRKMCEAINHPVITLKRVAVGRLQLGDLPRGKWRYLTKGEVEQCIQS